MKKSWVIVVAALLWVALAGCSSSSQVWLDSPVQPDNRCGAAFGANNPAGGQAAHTGVDICPGAESQILAVADGTLVWNQWWPAGSAPNGHGITAVVDHGGMYTYHAHMSRPNPDLKLGDHISQGDVLGWVGQTGYGTGPHLHFAVSIRHPDEYEYDKWVVNTDWLNPDNYLGKEASSRPPSFSWWWLITSAGVGLLAWLLSKLISNPQTGQFVSQGVLFLASPEGYIAKKFLGIVLREAFKTAMVVSMLTILIGVMLSPWGSIVIDWLKGSSTIPNSYIVGGLVLVYLLAKIKRKKQKPSDQKKKDRAGCTCLVFVLLATVSFGFGAWRLSQTKVAQEIVATINSYQAVTKGVQAVEQAVDTVVTAVTESEPPKFQSQGSVTSNYYTAQRDIRQAVKLEGLKGAEAESMAKLLTAKWWTETATADCQPFRDICPGQCCSYAGAKGPFQFMDGTWPTYSEPGWDKWDLIDSARAACRMAIALKLDQQKDAESFALRFSGLDGGLCWNYGQDGYQQGLRVWKMWKQH